MKVCSIIRVRVLTLNILQYHIYYLPGPDIGTMASSVSVRPYPLTKST
jgi:hypothetical protein